MQTFASTWGSDWHLQPSTHPGEQGWAEAPNPAQERVSGLPEGEQEGEGMVSAGNETVGFKENERVCLRESKPPKRPSRSSCASSTGSKRTRDLQGWELEGQGQDPSPHWWQNTAERVPCVPHW